METNIRKFDEAAKESLEAVERLGIHLCRVPHPCRALVPEARVGYHKSQPSPFLWLFRSPLPSPKRRQKCRKSAQITPGNHLSTPTPSTTYEEKFAKTPPPPPF